MEDKVNLIPVPRRWRIFIMPKMALGPLRFLFWLFPQE